MLLRRLLLCLATPLLMPAIALADCTSPASPVGGFQYFPANSIWKLCDGTNWKDFNLDGGTFGSCSSVSDLDYDISFTPDAYKFCDGANWKKVACTASGGCTLGTWTAYAAAEANLWSDLTYGNGLFVAVSQNGTNQVMTSPDGMTWTPRATGLAAASWAGVTYGAGQFVAVGLSSGKIMTSPDAITWTQQSHPSCGAQPPSWTTVAYGNGIYVAGSYNGGCRFMRSTNGVTWTLSTPPAGQGRYYSIAYGNGLFVAVGNTVTATNIATSPDGITWTNRTSPENTTAWTSVTFGNGLFVAVNAGGVTYKVATSPDGITWTGRTEPQSLGWSAVTHGNGLFVAVTSTAGDQVMTSPDGITWTPSAEPEANVWTGVAYGNSRFSAVSNTGTNRVMTSTCGGGCTLGTCSVNGQIDYNVGSSALVYCDGSNWRIMAQ